MENELLTNEFVDCLYENMWQFMNPNMISHMLQKNRNMISFQDDINDENFNNSHKNTICFKGEDEKGHYVYVSEKGTAFGTYECELLLSGDDGVCHGAAIAYYLHTNDPNFKIDLPRIKKNKKTLKKL